MSGGTVCVLAPNGRRNTIKYTPNTTILEILEEVCRKQNLKPDEYDLKHHNKILDTSAIFRFSGLPNNAQLELVPLSRARSETEIILAVNLENGNRLIGNFTPSDTLMKVLKTLCAECLSTDKNPVIIYMRQEIYGDNLEKATLRSLGITGGRAMMRLVDKDPEQLKVQANIAKPLPHKPAEEKPYVRKLVTSTVEEKPKAVEVEDTDMKANEIKNKDVEMRNNNDVNKSNSFKKGGTFDVIKFAKEKRKSTEDSSLTYEKRPNIENEPKTCTEINVTDPIKMVSKNTCNFDENQVLKIDSCGKNEETNVTSLDENIEDQFVFLGERNAMLFSLETAQTIPSEELPDDFFDLTIDDAKRIIRDVRKQQHHMADAPLMTAALRNLEESKKQLRQLNKYKKAIIRIQFPDRTVLQGTFTPIETMKEVIEFVKGYLENQSLPFYLYTTPPKEILDENKSLIELGFVPGAMIHFGTDNIQSKSYLRKDVQDKFTSNSVASLAAAKMRTQNTRSGTSNDDDEDLNMEIGTCIITSDVPSTSSGVPHTNEKKPSSSKGTVPKWFKP